MYVGIAKHAKESNPQDSFIICKPLQASKYKIETEFVHLQLFWNETD